MSSADDNLCCIWPTILWFSYVSETWCDVSRRVSRSTGKRAISVEISKGIAALQLGCAALLEGE